MNRDELRDIDKIEEMPEFLTFEEVAKMLKVKKPTLYRYINREKNPLPVTYINNNTPRILKKQFNLWIDQMNEEKNR